MKRRELLLSSVALTVSTTGCLGRFTGGSEEQKTTSYTNLPTEVKKHLDYSGSEVTIEQDMSSENVTVSVGPNKRYSPDVFIITPQTTVTWNWAEDNVPHSVTQTNGDLFDTPIYKHKSASFSHKFLETGIYLYECKQHSGFGMKGAIIVKQDN